MLRRRLTISVDPGAARGDPTYRAGHYPRDQDPWYPHWTAGAGRTRWCSQVPHGTHRSDYDRVVRAWSDLGREAFCSTMTFMLLRLACYSDASLHRPMHAQISWNSQKDRYHFTLRTYGVTQSSYGYRPLKARTESVHLILPVPPHLSQASPGSLNERYRVHSDSVSSADWKLHCPSQICRPVGIPCPPCPPCPPWAQSLHPRREAFSLSIQLDP